ncbi:hypothetical protein MHI39_07300 [Heyndrickxia sp. FSL K6-6286]|uniref:hypothetical protein n=1 Tax=Heyndrickxia sp. FSL K6-6286 TaxID=2921510 RepID=UPI00315A3ED6
MDEFLRKARLQRISQFCSDWVKFSGTMKRGRIPKRRVQRLKEYTLFFEGCKQDDELGPVAEKCLTLISKLDDYRDTFNKGENFDEVQRQADVIIGLVNDIERLMGKVFENGI